MGQEQEVSQQRTSSTAWLHPQHCPAPLDAFSARTSNLSGLPTNNGENLQVVRYQAGEQFQVHTDHLDSFNEMDCGGVSKSLLPRAAQLITPKQRNGYTQVIVSSA